MQVMTRRQFVRNTTVLATGLALTGMTGLMPARALAAKPQFLQTRCTGGDARSPMILVAYASMHGSTGEVADTIAKDLCRQAARSFLEPVFEIAPEVKPSCVGLFPGVLDYSKYSKGMGAVMHYKMWAKGIEEGDYRNWSMVQDFSRQFQSQLVQRGLLADV